MTSPLERLLAFALALASQLVAGILGAFGLAAKRAIEPIHVERGTADDVIDVRHAVLRSGRPRETAVFAGDEGPATRHWVARQHDRVVGVVSVMQAPQPDVADPALWQLRGMAVLEELQGAGVGRALLVACQAEVDAPMWCNARAHVASFYARNGWETVGEPFPIEPIGPHVRMRYNPAASAISR